MRIVDLLFAFPSFVLALFLMVVLGFGVPNVVIAIALVYFPLFARLTRNTALLVKEEPYIQAARLMRQPTPRILFLEILPNIGAPILVQASVGVAFGVVIEAGLSFLGLGVQPPDALAGVIMADGREYFQRGPWVRTCPGSSSRSRSWASTCWATESATSLIRACARRAVTRTAPPRCATCASASASATARWRQCAASTSKFGAARCLASSASPVGQDGEHDRAPAAPPENACVTVDALTFAGEPVLEPSPAEFRAWRGRRLAMIFQNPAGAFNPAKTIGWHLARIAERRVEIGRAQSPILARRSSG